MKQADVSIPSMKIGAFLAEILERYGASPKDEPVDLFMHRVLAESGRYESDDKIETVVRQISGTIDSIREGHLEIQDYKRRGLSSGVWLRDAMDTATKSMLPEEKTDLVVSVKQAMSLSNSALLSALTSGQAQEAMVPGLATSDFSGIDKTGIAQNFAKEIQTNSQLNALNFEGVTALPSIWGQEIQAAKDYFETVLDAESDDDFKKVVSTGIELAKENALLPEAMSEYSTEELTAVVDKGVATAKVAYKVAQGELDVTEATDYLIDRATSTVGAMIKHGCEHYGGVAGTAVGGFVGGLIGTVLGPQAAVIGAKIGHEVGKLAGKVVGEVLVEGAKKVASAAKTVVNACVEGVKSGVSSFCDWVSSFF